MHPHSSARAISNVLAVAVIAGGVVWGLESIGVQTGVPQVLVCRVGGTVMLGLGPGLLQLAMVFGIMLCLPAWTRGLGTKLVILAIGGMVAVELWAQHAGAYCHGSTS